MLNKRFYKYFLATIFMAVLFKGNAYANSAAAGELTYTWLRDSTYAVLYKHYNDCRGNAAAGILELCVYNTCNNASFTTIIKPHKGNIQNNAIPNGSEIFLGCDRPLITACSDPSSALPGYREWWYTDTITLPGKCTNWKFSVSYATRNTDKVTTGGNFYTEATLDNFLTHQNSSPVSASSPLLFYCIGQPVTYQLNITDADGDSLVFTTVHPQTKGLAICPPVISNIGIKSANPPFNTTNNPFQANNTFVLDASTQSMRFTPGAEGAGSFSIRIDEYRNGRIIGSMLRNMQIYSFSCSSTKPMIDNNYRVFYTDTLRGADTTGTSMIACMGIEMDWHFYILDMDTNVALNISSNAATVLPGSTVSFSTQNNDTVYGHLKWTPSATDTGRKKLEFYIGYKKCYPPAISSTFSFPIDIDVPYGISLGNDVAICSHESARLWGRGGYSSGANSIYNWQMLPGSTGTLTCTPCEVAYGNPDPTATYVLKSSAPWCPHVFTDTITVTTLNAPVAYPIVNITAAPSSDVWPGLNVTFTAHASGCDSPAYQWRINNQVVPGTNAATWISTTLSNGDIVTCHIVCTDTCASPRDTFSNAIIMKVATSVPILNYKHVKVYPNPNNGTFTIALNDFSGQPVKIEIVNLLGQVIHTIPVTKQVEHVSVKLQAGLYVLKALLPDAIEAQHIYFY